MLVVGVTGGICCGKSTVTATLASLGAQVIDADKLGHLAYVKGSECMAKIVSAFGERVVDEDGGINRRVLGGIVFSDPSQMLILNEIVWPYIRTMIETEINNSRNSPSTGNSMDITPDADISNAVPPSGGNTTALRPRLIVVEAAVLIEAGWTDLVEEVWVVEVDREVAIRRLMARNGLSEEESAVRVDCQMSATERRRFAHRVIRNEGSVEDLRRQVMDMDICSGGETI